MRSCGGPPAPGAGGAVGQANNALVYPGIGLGVIVARASRVTDGMLLTAAQAIAGLVDVTETGAGLLPDVENLRATSATVAVAVAVAGDRRRCGANRPHQSGPSCPRRYVATHLSRARGRLMTTVAQSRVRDIPLGTEATGTRTESDSMGQIAVPAHGGTGDSANHVATV